MSGDGGLQPERTVLAWRRTVLALAVGALVSVRVLAGVLGDLAIAIGLAGLLAAAALWIAARRRAAEVDAALRPSAASAPARPLPGGALLAGTAALTAAGAALGLLRLLAGVAVH